MEFVRLRRDWNTNKLLGVIFEVFKQLLYKLFDYVNNYSYMVIITRYNYNYYIIITLLFSYYYYYVM